MKNRNREVILGAIVFVAASILVVGSVWLSDQYAGAHGGYKLVVNFESVSGLNRGAPVTIRGVKVGKVLSVNLDNGKPMVTMGFASLRALPRDSQVLLKSMGMLGEQVVEVRVGSDPRALNDGELIIGTSTGGMEELTANAAEIAEHLHRVVGDVANDENISHIDNILVRMDSTTEDLQATLDESRKTLATALDSIAAASAHAQGLLGDNRAGVNESVENLRAATQRLAAMSKNLETSSTSLQQTLENLSDITGRIREGEGTLGHMVTDEEVYVNLRNTLATMDSLMQDIKKDPKRYFSFSVF